MTRKEGKSATPTDNKIRRSAFITVICDVILIVTLMICLLTYTSSNSLSNYEQNADNISNIAAASSQLVQTALDNMSGEIAGAHNFCSGKSVQEMLDYLSLVNGPDVEYQLLTRDEAESTDLYHVYTGYSTKKDETGAYQSIRYEDTALALSLHTHAANKNGDVSYSQSFTNKTNALRYFSLFCGVNANVDGESQRYFLVKLQKESRLLNQAQTFTQYKDLSVAICYSDGKYLACDDGFRGENFYDYLYQYNGLSLDEKNELKATVQNDEDGGLLTYADYQKRECVFAYATCGEDGNWRVIVSVPTSEFVAENLLSFFPLMIILFLAVLLVFNVFRLLVIVKELRLSVQREKVANTSKSTFLSRMSHEIRTPLNAIIGYNTIAQGEITSARDDASHKQTEMRVLDCLSKSEIASKHLLTIINDVLDMSAIEGGKIIIAHDKFDFKELITSLCTVFYSQARTKGVGFEVKLHTPTDEWFVGDYLRVNQILTNLLSNAIKFTPDGGLVTLRITQPETEDNAAHIRFEVEDNGIGMTEEYLDHIWAPFEQADVTIVRRFGGSGLGLSITKNLVDLMAGSIAVRSVPGEGTTFTVDLTLEKAEQPTPSEAYDFSCVNALVVDDDATTCDYVRLLFNRCGAKCATVTSGADALTAISVAKEKGESFSVYMVDWKMAQMDGIETIRRINGIVGEELPIIILTAYDYSEVADEAAQVRINGFVSKPLFQSSLLDVLMSVYGLRPAATMKKNDTYDFGGARVILAEDNAMNMEIAKTILVNANVNVDCAQNGKDAIELFEAAAAGTYMAILMDVNMPVMDGLEATRTIRASSHPQARSIPIIAMTADVFAENVAEVKAAGMNEHISKPIHVPTLFSVLKQYI